MPPELGCALQRSTARQCEAAALSPQATPVHCPSPLPRARLRPPSGHARNGLDSEGGIAVGGVPRDRGQRVEHVDAVRAVAVGQVALQRRALRQRGHQDAVAVVAHGCVASDHVVRGRPPRSRCGAADLDRRQSAPPAGERAVAHLVGGSARDADPKPAGPELPGGSPKVPAPMTVWPMSRRGSPGAQQHTVVEAARTLRGRDRGPRPSLIRPRGGGKLRRIRADHSSSSATARTGEPCPRRIRSGKPKNVNRRPTTAPRLARFS